jgi:4-amino-4-deoxy-L-arabinose transferase-like glycosyltransferase
MSTRLRRWEWAALGAITAAAAVLRLIALAKVSPDPFYDAAVRSMTLSLHNFFFGAFEPGGSVSIDKPPVDLWLQVASVKLFGFSSTTLKLPEALAGIAAVPLLYLAVRRMWSPASAVAAAAALAVLPVEVITARSDTMDAVMMMLIVLALLLCLRSLERGSTGWLLGAAAILGLAFNVKLLESIIAIPGLLLLVALGLPGTWRRRALQISLAALVYVAVALSWLTATLLFPASQRPFAIGSSNGSAWNAAFVFNGTERLGTKSTEPNFTVYVPGHHYPEKTQSERDRIPIVPPSPTRLLARIGPLSGERLGMELLMALLLGIPAIVSGLLADRRAAAADPGGEAPPGGGAPREPVPVGVPADAGNEPATAEWTPVGERSPRTIAADPGPATVPAVAADAARIRRASAAGLLLWLLCGIVLFSHMARLHPRYVEAFTPAVAAVFGIGLAWVAFPLGRARLAWLGASMLVALFYADRLLYGRPSVWWIALLAAVGALVFALLARTPGPPSLARRLLAPAGVMVMAGAAILAVPVAADVTSIKTHVTDAGYVGAIPGEELRALSDYTRAHQRGARYQLAAASATAIGALIVQDARPVLVLTTYNARVFTDVAQLEKLIGEGQVRYGFLNTPCSRHGANQNPACSAPARWIRAHGSDVSHQAGLRGGTLWLLPGAQP